MVVPPLYHLPHGSELWAEIAALPEPPVIVAWMHPRPAEWLVREYAGREPATVIDLGTCDGAGEVCRAIDEALGPADGEGELRERTCEVSERWYPIIDRSRCTACRHCLQFCIFGVYETDEDGRVIAIEPDKCKPGCPACARVCPEGAIMFPLCDDPAIAGAPGTIMEPDAAARRMYYVRTGRTCPVCGQQAEAGELADLPDGVATCEECGSALEEPPESTEPSPVHQEIDDLIDALDDLAGGGTQ